MGRSSGFLWVNPRFSLLFRGFFVLSPRVWAAAPATPLVAIRPGERCTGTGRGQRPPGVLGMSAVFSRRNFLRGEFRTASGPVRPPWAVDDSVFLEGCTQCAECLARCPQGILIAGSGGFPEVDFSRGECIFCADCVSACEPGVLSRERNAADASPWEVKAVINRSCFNYQGVFCRVCADRCISRAIRFRPVRGGAFLPRVDHAHCNGCGACIGACPAGALRAERLAGSPNQAEPLEESPI